MLIDIIRNIRTSLNSFVLWPNYQENNLVFENQTVFDIETNN